jgi:putative phosphoserine phosphatase/1-acylglycerol-3-phosphate O-acyltransferase
VPIVLHNVKDALPKGGMLGRAATIRVSVLEPVPPEAVGSIREVSAQLEARYEKVLRGSREAALPGASSASAA